MTPSDPIDLLALPPEIQRIFDRGSLIYLVLSASGGKDSDAMLRLLPRLIQARGWSDHVKVSMAHTDMQICEWLITLDYVKRRAAQENLPLEVVTRQQGSLIGMIWARYAKRPDVPPFPSAVYRWCTSDKCAQIDKHLRKLAGTTGTVICGVGVRAAESPARARKEIWTVRDSVATRTRKAFSWNPLFNFSTPAIWEALGYSQEKLRHTRDTVQALRAEGHSLRQAVLQVGWPWHDAYAAGSERLSCAVCFLQSRSDMLIGIEANPELYRQLVQVEIVTGYSYQPQQYLGELRPDLLTEQQRHDFATMRARPRINSASHLKAPTQPTTQLMLF